MSARLISPFSRLASAAPVVLRVILGIVLAAHGWQKFSTGPSTIGSSGFASMGLPVPVLLAWVVTIIELVGGIMLVAGLLTRLWALLAALLMIGTTLVVKTSTGLIGTDGAGAELDLVILACAVAVLLLGPGKPSVDHAMGLEQGVPLVAEPGRRSVTA